MQQLPLVERVVVNQNTIPMYHLGQIHAMFQNTQNLAITTRIIELHITPVVMPSDSASIVREILDVFIENPVAGPKLQVNAKRN